MSIKNGELFRNVTHWLLIIMVIGYIVSGLGITQFRLVEKFTFGLLTKNLSFKLHENTWSWIIFLFLIIVHSLQNTIFNRIKIRRR